MPSFGARFGKLVREKRGIEGMSQDDLATKSDLTKARISDIETGKVENPQAKTIDRLCVALDISREERAACYAKPTPHLPPNLLEKLASRFGSDMPDASEAELEAFLMAKADEFREMRERLKLLAETEGRVSELVGAADVALSEGNFGRADDLLQEAETVQLQSSTIVALKKQAQLRIERANTALLAGDIVAAVDHFERSSRYFAGVDSELEAVNRHECVGRLRSYGYRYKSSSALYAAKAALQRNLLIWNETDSPERWGQTKNALGGVSSRLAQFDVPENAMSHLAEARSHYDDVRTVCSETFLPKIFAIASLDLASLVYSDSRLANSAEEHEKNIQGALRLQLSALRFILKSDDPRSWGIVHHNLGCSYVDLSNVRKNEAEAVADIENAIRHLELSFEVRNPDDSLQYWVASCRSLGEALLNMSSYSNIKDAANYAQRAFDVLNGAAARITASEHPHQWEEIQTQLARYEARFTQ